jgi:D-alanine-D-alanine ligase
VALIGPGPRALPPAEIDFSTFPRDKERIVGQSAKCDQTSFEYHNTERVYNFPPVDQRLLQQLSELAIKCWRLFELCGYARVDFRVDAAQQPWIFEINTNPCTLPDVGFAAVLENAGIHYCNGIQSILNEAIARGRNVSTRLSEMAQA